MFDAANAWRSQMKKRDYLNVASFSEGEIRPLSVGRRLWIGPVGTTGPEDANRVPIWLTPGPAFGTGAHPTTELCLRALDRHLQPGARVLDLGTGTGILAIAAARLGAREVVGLDIDPDAVVVGRANVLQNGVANEVRVERGTLADLIDGQPFSWVMANILAHIIAEFFEQGLPEVLAPGGWLVLSGFLRSQTPLVLGALQTSPPNAELELLAQEQQGEWTCIIARRPVR